MRLNRKTKILKIKTIAIKIASLLLIVSPSNLCAFDTLTASAKLDARTEKINVLFQLKTSVAIKVETANLPWFNPVGLTLVIVRAGTGECLKRVYIPESPIFGNTQLKANEISEGRLDLEDYFPNLKSENKDHALVLFWHWSVPNGMMVTFKNNEEGYGGWLFLQKYSSKEELGIRN